MGAAGYVAGYLGRFQQCYCHGGVIYGFVTWSLALALSALLIMPFTKYSMFYKYSLAHSVVSKATASPTTPAPTAAEPKKMMNDLASKPTTPSALAWSAWIMFILFFIGALSSCIGACCALCCRKEIITEKPITPMH